MAFIDSGNMKKCHLFNWLLLCTILFCMTSSATQNCWSQNNCCIATPGRAGCNSTCISQCVCQFSGLPQCCSTNGGWTSICVQAAQNIGPVCYWPSLALSRELCSQSQCNQLCPNTTNTTTALPTTPLSTTPTPTTTTTTTTTTTSTFTTHPPTSTTFVPSTTTTSPPSTPTSISSTSINTKTNSPTSSTTARTLATTTTTTNPQSSTITSTNTSAAPETLVVESSSIDQAAKAQLIMSALIVISVCGLCITIVLCAIFRRNIERSWRKRFGWDARNKSENALADVEPHNVSDLSARNLRDHVKLEVAVNHSHSSIHNHARDDYSSEIDRLTKDLTSPSKSTANIVIIDHSEQL